eukprot:2243906-Pleurochrysis_carterae.AAC.5
MSSSSSSGGASLAPAPKTTGRLRTLACPRALRSNGAIGASLLPPAPPLGACVECGSRERCSTMVSESLSSSSSSATSAHPWGTPTSVKCTWLATRAGTTQLCPPLLTIRCEVGGAGTVAGDLDGGIDGGVSGDAQHASAAAAASDGTAGSLPSLPS